MTGDRPKKFHSAAIYSSPGFNEVVFGLQYAVYYTSYLKSILAAILVRKSGHFRTTSPGLARILIYVAHVSSKDKVYLEDLAPPPPVFLYILPTKPRRTNSRVEDTLATKGRAGSSGGRLVRCRSMAETGHLYNTFAHSYRSKFTTA